VVHPSTPILVGCGQKTWKVPPGQMPTWVQMLETTARLALADTGAGGAATGAIDTVAVVSSTIEEAFFEAMNLPKPANPPRALARALEAEGALEVYTLVGGNTPQMVVNRLAEEIARGEVGLAVISGAEFLHNFWELYRAEADMSAWKVHDDPPAELWGDTQPGSSPIEAAHEMGRPANTYALIEQAIRYAKGESVADHQAAIGRLMSPFSRVAAQNPHAWFPVERSAEEIATETDKNRMVGFPYTKYMNSIMRVDMSASLVMTSMGRARELGIPENRWVYLHGCADAKDIWNVTERPDLARSPAIRGCWNRASAMANITTDDLDFIDLYSCFPSAVEIGCNEVGLGEDDPRGLTVTGGLPYFGGPGNNYATHSIATMMEKVRAKPGSSGLCTANGWFITKHSVGIYSTAPVEGEWSREDPSVLQAEIDAGARVEVAETPEGRGTIETCTVAHGRKGPMFGIVIGRLEDGRRFVANTDTKPATLDAMHADDAMGRTGTVTPTGEGLKNLFTFD